jgi:hypothetical protein
MYLRRYIFALRKGKHKTRRNICWKKKELKEEREEKTHEN